MRNWRINLIFLFFILFGAAIISRLIYIQIFQNDFYKALAHGQQKIFQPLRGERGEIFFKDGQPLAVNFKAKYLFALPEKIKDKKETAKIISGIIGAKEEEIAQKLEGDSLFVQIKDIITDEEEKKIEKEKLAGVYINEGVFRKYPQEKMASAVIGFLGGEGLGQYGIEGYYDDILQGKESFSETADAGFAKGTDLFLTLDYNIQFSAESLLAKAKKDLNIESGQIIVLEPDSGKILALAGFPDFDPNNYSEVDSLDFFQNAAIQKLFEPGSVFKPITMAASLDQGKIKPDTTYIDKGIVKIGGYKIYNYDNRVYGEQSMTGVLERSINTGAVFAESQIDHKVFLDYIKNFGFFEPTEVDLQGEVFSENKELKKGYEINYATASFGQGIEITPLQLVRAFSAICNKGKITNPYLVEKTTESKSSQIISSQTAFQLITMMVNVVENGFGKAAKIPGYYIAGKTGTAQVPESGAYSLEKTIQSFIGFAPAFNPRFLILVKLDNPQTKTAEYSAVPIFRELAKYIIDYWQILPDYE